MAESQLIRSLYNASPAALQNLMASVYGLQKNRYRFSHPKWDYWNQFYQHAGQWSADQMRDYQWREFQATLRHAVQTVPFYRDRYRELDINVEDVKTPDDVAKLPLTTKDDIRENSQRMISDQFDLRDLNCDPTSGSTGKPLVLYNDREAIVRNYAIRWARCRPGLTRQMRSANFTGLEIVRANQARPPFWRTNFAARQQLYSVFHMNDDTLPAYLQNLNRFRPEWLYGYPSALYTLAEFMLRNGLRLNHPIRAAVTSSEQCQPHYRAAIEAAFETKLWDEYGQAELAGLAFECECGNLHELPDYAYTEFVPTGEQVGDCHVYELICTSVINSAWPLIRYQVGDTALIDPNYVCPHGRTGQVIQQMHGRTSHFLLTKDGRRVSNISVMAKNCRNLKSCQAVQHTQGKITLRLVPDDAFSTSDSDHAVAEFRKKLGGESIMDIEVEIAERPLLTSAGKFLMIVSKLGKTERQMVEATR